MTISSMEASYDSVANEYYDKVFEMFQTLESRDDVENTGIGLALVRKIVEENEGAIRLESKEGKGMTVFFTWPKKKLSAVSD